MPPIVLLRNHIKTDSHDDLNATVSHHKTIVSPASWVATHIKEEKGDHAELTTSLATVRSESTSPHHVFAHSDLEFLPVL